MATMRHVADHAGVSPATVSRVFTHPEIVAPTARARVLAAAEVLGYQPNPVARSLARGRTGNLGLLVSDIANPFFAPLIKSVQHAARRRELALFVADSDEHADDERVLAGAMAKQVDGLVLAAPRMGDSHVRDIARLTPVVVFNRELDGVPAVLTPPDAGMAQAVEHLVALGHRSIVWLGGPREASSSATREWALRTACERYGLRLFELGPFEPRFESGVRAADVVIWRGATAAIAYNDQIALGLVARFAGRGVRVGSDVSVVGIDDSSAAHTANPPLTTIHVPAVAAGVVAVRMLVELAATGVCPADVVLPTELIVRSTTGAAPAGERDVGSE